MGAGRCEKDFLLHRAFCAGRAFSALFFLGKRGTHGRYMLCACARAFAPCGNEAVLWRVERVRITAFGISLGFSAPKTYGEELFVAAAGPLASFAFAALGHFCGGAFGGEAFSFSLFLGLINLLPFEGFDGGRIIFAAFAFLFGERTGACVCRALSYASLFAAWVIAVYIFFYSGVNFALLLFCAYIFVFTVIKKDCNFARKMVQ